MVKYGKKNRGRKLDDEGFAIADGERGGMEVR